jgi:hypothetical protein
VASTASFTEVLEQAQSKLSKWVPRVLNLQIVSSRSRLSSSFLGRAEMTYGMNQKAVLEQR